MSYSHKRARKIRRAYQNALRFLGQNRSQKTMRRALKWVRIQDRLIRRPHHRRKGDAAGEPPTGTEWGFFMGGRRPPIQSGDRPGKAARSPSPSPKSSPMKEDELTKLRGKNLACWCKSDAPCHADVLLEIANDLKRINKPKEI